MVIMTLEKARANDEITKTSRFDEIALDRMLLLLAIGSLLNSGPFAEQVLIANTLRVCTLGWLTAW